MSTKTAIFRLFTTALLAWAAAVPGHAAAHVATPSVPSLVQPAAANCTALGQSVAEQEGGTLQLATTQSRGGRTVCVIVFTVPGSNGKPPRRVEREVPAD